MAEGSATHIYGALAHPAFEHAWPQREQNIASCFHPTRTQSSQNSCLICIPLRKAPSLSGVSIIIIIIITVTVPRWCGGLLRSDKNGLVMLLSHPSSAVIHTDTGFQDSFHRRTFGAFKSVQIRLQQIASSAQTPDPVDRSLPPEGGECW